MRAIQERLILFGVSGTHRSDFLGGQTTMLTYDIQSEVLYGDVGNQRFHLHAVSGGGRGSTLKPEGDELLRSWSFRTKEDRKKGVRGGIIPPGFYICHYLKSYGSFHECIYLEQTVSSLLAPDPTSSIGVAFVDRGGKLGHGAFLIHAHGPKGSDGCIVIPNETERHRLNQAIRHHDRTPLQVVRPYLPDDLSPRDGTALA